MKVAILYICTGKYNQFFKGFFESCEKYLLKDIAQLEYYVFTDDMSLSDEANVHLIKKECAGFPADSLFRFDMFLQVRQELEKTDYIYFFNSNAEFKAPVGKELLPLNGEKLVGAEWPGKRKPFKHPAFYPYERNKHSSAYIPPREDKPYIYYMGGINGGEAADYLEMAETLSENIHADYEKGIVALVHDESHINKYFRTHDCKVLSAEYCFPEEWITCDFSPKIIFRDKVKLDPYFNKGRNYSLKGKLKKTVSVIYRAIRWYL